MQRVWCSTLIELQRGSDHQIKATAIIAGVAFVIAGLTQLIGMFVCCCCKAPAPQKQVYRAQPVQTMMMTPQPVYAAPAPQPAMIMYPEVLRRSSPLTTLACFQASLMPVDQRKRLPGNRRRRLTIFVCCCAAARSLPAAHDPGIPGGKKRAHALRSGA